MRRIFLVLAALTLLASACAPSGSDGTAGSDDTAGSDGTAGSDDLGSEGDAFDYATVDYDAPSVGNALFGDRDNDAFPPPVVPIEELRSGGPPPDGIPAIDAPEFVPASEVDFIDSDEEGIVAVTVGGVTKGYPIRILTWHEIVNDHIGDTPVTVTYCPLCNSALAYDRRLGERVLDFGTSGELYQSAMVMYDRQTQSLWSHFLGQGIIGHYAGAELEFLPAQTLGWGAFRRAYPEADVLSQNTGHDRSYGANPYVGYDAVESGPFPGFVTGDIDTRLDPKARILGVNDAHGAIAVPFELLADQRVVALGTGERSLVAFHAAGLVSALETDSVSRGADVGQTGVFVPVSADGAALTFEPSGKGFLDKETSSIWTISGRAIDGPLTGEQLTPVHHVDTFWFAWSTYRPDTDIVAIP